MLSHHVWQGTYGGDPSIVGATLFVEGHPFTVVGVTPPGFFGETLRGDPPDLWIPLQQEPLINGDTSILRQPISAWLRVIGRLRPGATTDGMGPRLTGILRQWMQHDSGYPANWMPDVIQSLPKQVITVVPAGAGVGIMKEQYGRSLQILLGVCGLVLLIACANVANLLLARAVARRGQTAVRLAMGASRRQIVTQALVESILLAVAGGIAGLVVAVGAARLLLALAFAGATFLPIDTRPAPMVLAFAFGLALLTGIVFGAAPAWFATRTDPIDALRGAGPQHRRSLVVRAQGAARRAGDVVGRARRRIDDARAQPRQPREPGLRLRDSAGASSCAIEPAAGDLHAARSSRRSIATSKSGSIACRACRDRGSRSTTRSPTTGASWCWSPAIRRRSRANRPARRGIASARTTFRTWA